MKKHYKPYDRTNGLNLVIQDAMTEAWKTNVRIIYDRGYEDGKQDATVNSKETYDQGYKAGQSSVSEVYSQGCKKSFSQGYDRGYCDAGAVILTAKEKLDRVRDEVEKLARKITIFDDWMVDSYKFIVNNTAQEAIKKVKAWEEKTRNVPDTNVGNIAVGDEVKFKSSDDYGIVTKIEIFNADLVYIILWKDGRIGRLDRSDLIKTGRSFMWDLSNLLSMIEGKAESEEK